MILRSGLVVESRPAAEPNMLEDTRSTQVEVGTPVTTCLTISDPHSQSSTGLIPGATGASSSLQPGQHFYTYGADILMDFVLYSPSIQDHLLTYPVEEQSHDHEPPRGLQGGEDPPQPGASQASSQPHATTLSYQENKLAPALQTQLRRLDTMRPPPSSHSPVENYTTASPPWSPEVQPTDFETHKRRISDITGVRGREHPEDRDFPDKLQEDLRKLEEGKGDEPIEGAEIGKRRSKRARKGTEGGMSSSTWTKKQRKDSNDKGQPPSGNGDGVEQPAGAV